jgi:rare lipoprotein A
VKVTNLANGRSTSVTINDRGPFARGRIIDVSAGAADVLGMRHSGVARVRVDTL